MPGQARHLFGTKDLQDVTFAETPGAAALSQDQLPLLSELLSLTTSCESKNRSART